MLEILQNYSSNFGLNYLTMMKYQRRFDICRHHFQMFGNMRPILFIIF